MTPRVSVIVACEHADAAARRACVESIRAQSLAEWEAVLVGAAEHVVEPRFVHLGRTPGGRGGAWNAGLEVSRGPCVLFMDARDSLTPIALESLMRIAEKDLAAVGGSLRCDGSGGARPSRDRRPIETGAPVSPSAARPGDAGKAPGLAAEPARPGQPTRGFAAEPARPGQPEPLGDETVRIGLPDLLAQQPAPIHAFLTHRDRIGAARFCDDRAAGEDYEFLLRLAERGVRWRAVGEAVANHHLRPLPRSSAAREIIESSLRISEQAAARARWSGASAACFDDEGRSAAMLDRLRALAVLAMGSCGAVAAATSRLAGEALVRRALAGGQDPADWIEEAAFVETVGAQLAPAPMAGAALWWVRQGLVGRAPSALADHARTAVASLIGAEARAPRLMAERCDPARAVVLLGLGKNARRIAGHLAARGHRLFGRDDALKAAPAWAKVDGVRITFLGPDRPWDSSATYLMTPLDDAGFMEKIPAGIAVVRWRDVLREIEEQRADWLGDGLRIRSTTMKGAAA